MQQLTALNETVGNDDQVAVLLSSLEDITKYSDILVVLRVGWNMGYEDMVAILLNEDRHLSDKGATDLEKVLFSKGKFKNKTLKCNYCKKLGYTKDRSDAML